MKKESTANHGFTLIETMVAIAILLLAVAGPLVVASRAMIAAEIAQDQLTASNLAQEGIEYVRMMRDDEYLAAYQAGGTNVSITAWNNFLNNYDPSSNPASVEGCRNTACTLDLSATGGMGTGSGYSLMPCDIRKAGSCAPLYLAPTGVYNESQTGTPTPFTRTIEVIDTLAPGITPGNPYGNPYPDKRVVSTVSWLFQGVSYSVTVTDQLTPWQ
jgi:prepilin-type N-terminal cleavage/methylation domain-containing protein